MRAWNIRGVGREGMLVKSSGYWLVGGGIRWIPILVYNLVKNSIKKCHARGQSSSAYMLFYIHFHFTNIQKYVCYYTLFCCASVKPSNTIYWFNWQYWKTLITRWILHLNGWITGFQINLTKAQINTRDKNIFHT